MAHEAQETAVGDALIAFLAPRLASLSLASFAWSRNHRVEPGYPDNPVTQLPRMRLRSMTGTVQPGPPRGGSVAEAAYNFSLWLQLRQTPGQQHQKILRQALDLVETQFLDVALVVDDVSLLPGYQLFGVNNIQSVVHDELRHEFDDPRLRVSVGELNLSVVGRTSNC